MRVREKKCMIIAVRAMLVTAFLANGGAARAQFATDIRFNFLAPGARSLAMGGAFIGLADDATAAYTNPAGLSNLSIGGPEVAAEFRHWRSSTLFLDRGNLIDDPTGIGIDTIPGSKAGSSESTTQGLSFLSVGYVFPRRWTAALYWHELVNDRSETVSQGLFALPNTILGLIPRGGCNPGFLYMGDPIPCRFYPTRSVGAVRVANLGVSAAYQFSEPLSERLNDSLSLGFGVAWSQSDFEAVTDIFKFQPRDGNPEVDRLPGHLFGPVDLTGDRLLVRLNRHSDETDYAWTAGFLWRLGADQRWSVGGAYRRGPGFLISGEEITGPAGQSAEMPVGSTTPSQSDKLRIPSSFGIGLAYTAAQGKTKIALDYDRVFYSQRLKAAIDEAGVVRQKDADEYHLGIEHVFLSVGSLFVATARAGAWYETGHEPEFVPAFLDDPDFQKSFLQAEDHVHWSAGLGLVVKEDFQIDVGADFSDPIKTFSLSLVRFF